MPFFLNLFSNVSEVFNLTFFNIWITFNAVLQNIKP